VKEIERVGLPITHITTITPVSRMVGANRILPAAGIIHPVGDAELSPDEELRLRRSIVEAALRALTADLKEQTIFPAVR